MKFTSGLLLAAPLVLGCNQGLHTDFDTDTDGSTGGETTESSGGETTESSGGETSSSTSTGEETQAGPCGGAECGAQEACIADSCVDVSREDVEAGCNPFAQGQCMYPWPSNVFTREEPGSPTGLMVDHDASLLPANNAGDPFAVDQITNHLDGFSPNSQLRFVTPGGVDAALLPGIDDIELSMTDDSPIVLIDMDTGERWPYFAEVEARATGTPNKQAVFIRPMRRLNFGHRYAVGVRSLNTQDGGPLEVPPLFGALRDNLETDVPELEALRDSYEQVFGALEQAGVARDSLQLAWDFTTVTRETLQAPALDIIPQITPMVEGGDLGFTVNNVEVGDGTVLYTIKGTFNVPNCMNGDAGPGELLRRDGDGGIVCEGTVEAPFTMGIPNGVAGAGVPVPAIVYGHGLLGSGEEAASVAGNFDKVIVIGTDFWGMSSGDLSNVVAVFENNFDNGQSIPERLLQSVVNFTTLGYLVAGEDFNSQIPELAGPMGSLIDTEQVHYIGGSQGGIMGGTVVGLAPNLNRGVLGVGGANYSLMVWRSTAFEQVNTTWGAFHTDELEREFLFALYQSAFDFSDPLTFDDLVGPGSGKSLLLLESIGDAQVPNISSEMLGRTYGMEMLDPPIYPVYGLPGTTEPVAGHSFLQVDTGKGPLPPKENIPPEDDNGAHGAAADGPGVQDTLAMFLAGPVSNQCDGPCDPD